MPIVEPQGKQDLRETQDKMAKEDHEEIKGTMVPLERRVFKAIED